MGACLRQLTLVAALLLAGAAQADIWGYVDGQGIAHFADTRLDERYELFSRSGQGFASDAAGTAQTAAAPAALRPLSVPGAPPRLMAFFEVSPGYKQVRHLLREASLAQGLDYELLKAVIAAESGFDAGAVSPKGAVGLMQIMPATAHFTPSMINDRETNIAIGTGYLKIVLEDFNGSLPLAAAAYNAGPSRPRNWRNGPVMEGAAWAENVPFNETRDYVKKVLANTTMYAAILSGQPQSLRARLGNVGPRDPTLPEPNRDIP